MVAIDDAASAGWEGDPAFETFELGSYLGTTVTVDGEVHSTLFFASRTPRAKPFSDAEKTLDRLMGKWIEYELERRGTADGG